MNRRLLPATLACLVLVAACGGGGGGGDAAPTGASGAPVVAGGDPGAASASGPPAVAQPGGATSTPGAPAAGTGTATPVASNFRAFGPVTVSSNTGPQPAVTARLAGGGSVVVWHTWAGALNAQRLGVDGDLLGGTIEVAASGSQDVRPAVAALSGGGFAVAWADPPSAGGTTTVRVRRFDAGGLAASPITAASTVLNAVGEIEAVSLADGGFAIAWSGTPLVGGPPQVAVQRFGPDLQPGTQAQPVGASSEAQRRPRLAVLPDGSLVLAWLQAASPGVLPSFTVNLQRFTAAGAAVGSARAVAAATGAANFQHDLAGLSNGTLALVWQSFGSSSVAGVDLQLLDADGGPTGPVAQLPGTNGVSSLDPQVESLGPGGFVVTWQQLEAVNIRQVNANVFAQRFGNDGAPAELPQQIASYGQTTTTGQSTGLSSVAGGSDGHFLVAYDRWLAGSFVDLLGR